MLTRVLIWRSLILMQTTEAGSNVSTSDVYMAQLDFGANSGIAHIARGKLGGRAASLAARPSSLPHANSLWNHCCPKFLAEVCSGHFATALAIVTLCRVMVDQSS